MDKSLKEHVTQNPAAASIFGIETSIEEMDKKELIKHLTNLLNIFSWLPAEVQHFASGIGNDAAIVTRDYKAHYGTYMGFEVEIIAHKINSTDRVFDNLRRQWFIETARETILANNLTMFKWVTERQEDVEIPTYSTLDPPQSETVV